MEWISVAEAARRLGLSDVAVYKALRAGRLERANSFEPAKVTLASVQLLAEARKLEALKRHPDAVTLARRVVAALHPPKPEDFPGSYMAFELSHVDRGRAALARAGQDAYAVFGSDVIEACAVRDTLRRDGACPVCWAYMSAKVHGTRPPTDAPAFRILLGEPCERDRARWTAEAAARRREADRIRLAEARKREQSEQARRRAEFNAARTAAQSAAERLRTATTAYATVNPSVVASATAQARARGAFKAQSRYPDWCTCDDRTQCTRHAEMDRQAARRPGPFGR